MTPTRQGGPGRPDPAPGTHGIAEAAEAVAAVVKPHLRGWIHAGMAPIAAVAGIVLVVLAPTTTARWSTAVFAFATTLLFTASAVYHRGRWSPRTTAALRRLDHSNILLVIAGTYTPLAALLLPPTTALWLLVIVWSGALAGILARVFWLGAPRWFYVPLYMVLGWISVAYLPAFWQAGGHAIVILVATGGLAYSVGAVVYALKRPNPSPRWFGFHEVFHVLTVVGYVCHYIAVSIASAGSA
jgi:hemolysin III